MSRAVRGSAGVPAWPSAAVERLCGDDGRFERVPADEEFARRVLDQLADDGEVWLFAAAKGRWPKAHTLSYDAARKSVEALLLTRGWRVTGRRGGAHQAVVAVVEAWLSAAPPPGPRIVRKFAGARTRTSSDEQVPGTPNPRWVTVETGTASIGGPPQR